MRSLSRSRVSGCNEGGVSDAVGRSGIGWWKVCVLASIVKLGIEMQECCPLISAIAPQLNFCFEVTLEILG
ncbi:unnamed protein product [Rhodiola kirilowii]